MSWTVTLEDENGNALGFISTEIAIPLLNDVKFRETFSLLKYLDPYGDVIFNNLQIDDLIKDLHYLEQHTNSKLLVREITSLAKQCKEIEHTYLVFRGD